MEFLFSCLFLLFTLKFYTFFKGYFSLTVITNYCLYSYGFPGGASGKEPACQCRRRKRHGFEPWLGKIPWRREWQLTAEFLLRESHGQRSLVGHSPWSHKESDRTEQLALSLSFPFTPQEEDALWGTSAFGLWDE